MKKPLSSFFLSFFIVFSFFILSCNNSNKTPAESNDASLSKEEYLNKALYDKRWCDSITRALHTDKWKLAVYNDMYHLVVSEQGSYPEYYVELTHPISYAQLKYIVDNNKTPPAFPSVSWNKVEKHLPEGQGTYSGFKFTMDEKNYTKEYLTQAFNSYMEDISSERVVDAVASLTAIDDTRDQLSKLYDDLLRRCDSISGVNNSLQSRAGELLEKIEARRKDISRILRERNVTEADLKRARTLIAEFNDELHSLEDKLK